MDKHPEQGRLPLIEALLTFSRQSRSGWHMPGHRSGRQWPTWLRDNLSLLDSTELASTDDLLQPTGPAAQSLAQAACFYGSGWTRYLTSGSSTGILAMLAAYPGHGGRLLISRSVHQSVMHAIILLELEVGWIEADLWPLFSDQDPKPLSLLPQISYQSFCQAAAAFGPYDAVLVTSPDYYGTCAPLDLIAARAHADGGLLLVDEAHGAHFPGYSQGLPRPALQQGADITVQSAHKTLPALTGASLIHISQEALDQDRVQADKLDRSLQLFHSSSPSFLIAASIEYALYWLQDQGPSAIERNLEQLAELGPQLADHYRLSSAVPSCLTNMGQVLERDPLRLIISPLGPDLSAGQTASFLRQDNLEVELVDLERLVLIPALDQSAREFAGLRDLLQAATFQESQAQSSRLEVDLELDAFWRQSFREVGRFALSPAKAWSLGPKLGQPQELTRALDSIAADPILAYPPGIALLWPGEVITANRLTLIKLLKKAGIFLKGLDGQMIRTIQLTSLNIGDNDV